MKKTIALLPGDGIGPEIILEAKKVLEAVADKYDHEFEYEEALIGASAIDKTGSALPEETISICLSSDAVLFGAIGDPKYDNDPTATVRPEQGILGIRKALGLFANIRPINTYERLLDMSPLKRDIVEGVDIVFIRELTGGIYFGTPRERRDNGNTAVDTSIYTREEIERVGNLAIETSRTRSKKVTVVDKANVLETSRLWREVMQEIAKKNNDIEVEYLFVDNASMQIIKNPRAFDVIVTENMFGDILTDEASVITGSIGMLPSASIGEKTSLYEPIHGSYPKAAGKGTANPIGTILSAALMLEYSFGMYQEAERIRLAVETSIDQGIGTKDIIPHSPLTTYECGSKIASTIAS